MIESSRFKLKPQSIDKFNEYMLYNKEHKKWRGLVLTGAEITLHRDLCSFVERARESGFERIRIQTNGIRLADKHYCESLINAGVNEFFISAPGWNDSTNDTITGIPGSFEKMVTGLENLESAANIQIITNTVVTNKSYHYLPELVDHFRQYAKLVQMEFWIYWPMGEYDTRNLIASHREILPKLMVAIRRCRECGINIEIKNFPECLLGEHCNVLINDQPELHIDPTFWNAFENNGFYQCAKRLQCRSKQCLGLNTAYIAKYGWENDLLQPIL
jgi:MoaA/NifB/PqqE/SkfB family radical SAM enzyme